MQFPIKSITQGLDLRRVERAAQSAPLAGFTYSLTRTETYSSCRVFINGVELSEVESATEPVADLMQEVFLGAPGARLL